MSARTRREEPDSSDPYADTVRLPVLELPGLRMPFEIVGEGSATLDRREGHCPDRSPEH